MCLSVQPMDKRLHTFSKYQFWLWLRIHLLLPRAQHPAQLRLGQTLWEWPYACTHGTSCTHGTVCAHGGCNANIMKITVFVRAQYTRVPVNWNHKLLWVLEQTHNATICKNPHTQSIIPCSGFYLLLFPQTSIGCLDSDFSWKKDPLRSQRQTQRQND